MEFNIQDAYRCISTTEEASHIFSVQTPCGLMRQNRMPYGFVNAVAIFNKLMFKILEGCHNCQSYLDDIIVHNSGDFSQHIASLRQLFTRIRASGVKLKAKKAALFKRKLHFLGLSVSKYGV